MIDVIRKEILYDISQAIDILEVKEEKDLNELEKLSEHAIDDVALHKDTDLITITVLIYSIYKIVHNLSEEDYKNIVAELKFTKKHLEENQLGRYNQSIKNLYNLIRKSDAKIKQHLQDVMQAARIKKSSSLLQKGLSIGQAAGLMGLSNWDLQPYAGKTTYFEQHHESIPAKRRVINAMKIFGV
ncbi:MAG: hypothetical protein ABH824_02875 [Nanoarchaeota archaeon]|nr:hypothetical protein [Nanoarchaeota archaeon]MBU1632080.1 hypothetical protein [Nanoarchaeota archaeon]MBU1875714.1 hypothetical protein [Nanoarchaeota archaeon]